MSLGETRTRTVFDCWVELPIQVTGKNVFVNMQRPVFLSDTFLNRKEIFRVFEGNVGQWLREPGLDSKFISAENSRQNAARTKALMGLVGSVAASAFAGALGAQLRSCS